MRGASPGSGRNAAKGLIVAISAAQATARCAGTHAESKARPLLAHARAAAAARFRAIPLAEERGVAARLATGPDGLPARGCRDARTLVHWLDAQPGAHGGGLVPGEEPLGSLARGRPLVLGHAGGCRPDQQHPGWQWTAGCGADAAPFFRIFNPVSQGEKFDPEGSYVRRWVPELARLPAAWIHQPWAAPPSVLAAAGVELGQTYPRPVFSLGISREVALEAYRRITR